MADPTNVPDIERVKDWLGQGALHVLSADLETIRKAQINIQKGRCFWPDTEVAVYTYAINDPLPEELVEALLRRCARSVATKGIPLGVIVGGDEFQGQVTVRRWDVMIEELENDWIKPVLA